MSLIDKLVALRQEHFLKGEEKKIISHPDQIVIRSDRSLMLFQPHHVDHYTAALWKSTLNLVTYNTDLMISKGQPIGFFLEHASKDQPALVRKINDASRKGDLSVDELFNRINIERAQQGDASAVYRSFLSSMLLSLKSRYNTLGSQPRVWSMLEEMPRIQSIGNNVVGELDPRYTPLEHSLNRFSQIMAYSLTRDIALAGKIIQELTMHPNLAITVIRGTEHLGLVVALVTMAEKAYPQFAGTFGDIDKERETLCSTDMTAIASRPIKWSRKLWEEIFKRKPYLLQMPNTFHQGMDMHDTAALIRELLHEDPWMSYVKQAFSEIVQLPDEAFVTKIILSQKMFS